MWLKRILSQSDYGSSPSGGAGSDMGGSIPVFPGQASLFSGNPEDQEKRYNARKRRAKRKRLERKRKWRLSKDPQ